MKAKQSIQFVVPLCLILVVFISSCTTSYHAPANMMSVGLQKQNALKIGMFDSKINTGHEAHKDVDKDYQIAYSPFKNIGLIYHSNTFIKRFTYQSYSNRTLGGGCDCYFDVSVPTTGRLHNIGVGLYKNLSPNWIVDSYITIGNGDYYEKREQLADLRKYAIQTGIHYKREKFEIGFVYNLSRLDFNNINVSRLEYYRDPKGVLSDVEKNFHSNLALTTRLGIKYVSVQHQIGGSVNHSNPHASEKFEMYGSMGFFFNVDQIFKRIKDKFF